jgi:subtilase family serine protease
MKTMLAFPKQLGLRVFACLAGGAIALSTLGAQAPAPRIQSEISSAAMTPLQGSQHPLAQARFDAGRVPADTKLEGITLYFKRSAQQEAALQALIKAQQNSSSPQFHKWLTPDQFAASFGMASSDIDKAESWLQQQGFSIDSVARSRNAIHFSGSAGQVEQAFSTQMHYYTIGGQKHFAPSTALSLPAALASVVTTVRNLDDFRPKPMYIRGKAVTAKPQYTFCGNTACSTADQGVLFAPPDLWTVYSMTTLRSAGDTGAGQVIAIMGQSAIQSSDLANFQEAAGLTVTTPTMTLVPGTGTSTVEADGDEAESDIDTEWSSAIATGAAINFVYTGSNENYGVFDSYQYAVDEQIGNIISMSYGSCEPELGQSNWAELEQIGEQATTQGQTVIASSGDSGATGCYGYSGLTNAQMGELAVNYPASSAYVTGVGGTEISSTNDVVGTYWTEASTTDDIILSSATQYIPEIAWNDDAASAVSGCNTNDTYLCISSSGGGISTFTAQPSWQTSYFTATAESNPSTSYRLVPDVALYASPEEPGYLYCTSDESAWQSGQEASCGDSEFYDPVSDYFTVAGGTSFAAPIFAGEVAILNQTKGYAGGQGLLNTTLYSLASTSATYSTAFNDITSGNNECTESSAYCPSNSGYSAGTGYDLVTGLGSLNLAAFVSAWPQSTSTALGTVTTVTASSLTPTVNTSDTITVTVAADSGSAAPTGSVNVSIDAGTATSYTLTASGTASSVSFSYTFTSAGPHTISAIFEPSSTATFALSTGTLTLTAEGTSSGTGTFTLAATNVTAAEGSSGTSTVTATPAGGYTGTVDLTITTTNTNLENYGCYGVTDPVVTGTSAATGSVTIGTSEADCSTADLQNGKKHRFAGASPVAASHSAPDLRKILPASLAGIFGLVLVGSFRKRAKGLGLLGCLLLLGSLGFAIGCGGSVSSNTQTVPEGTYTITVTGNDSSTSSITSNTTFTLTIN